MPRLGGQRLATWMAALTVLAGAAYIARQRQIYGVDFVPIHDGARSMRIFQDPYQLVGQYGPNVYPPIVAVVLLPLAFVSQQAAVAFGMLLSAASIVVLSASLAATLGYSWRGRCAALALALLAASHLGFATLTIGNLSMFLGAGTALALAFAVSGRWLLAALALGSILAVKPIVFPVLLIFVLDRRWRDGGVAIVVPAVLNLAALPFLADPGRFFTDTLPSLAAGATLPLEYNQSVGAVVERAGGGAGLQVVARTTVVIVTAAVVALAWRRSADTERLLIVGLVPVAGLVLASGTDQLHYALPLLPLLVYLTARGEHMARPVAAVALLLLAIDFGFGGTTSQLLVLAAGGLAAGTAVRHKTVRPAPVAPGVQGVSPSPVT